MKKNSAVLSAFVLMLSFGVSAFANDHKASEKTPEKGEEKHADSKRDCERLSQKTAAELWELSDCYYSQGEVKKTLQALKQISQKDPHELDAFFTASWLTWNQGARRGGAEARKLALEGLEELQRARVNNPSHWEVDTELGDYYFLRLNLFDKAYAEYLRAREHYDGDYSRNVPKAEPGRKAAIENRIARTAERLDRKGEAVEASCRALFFDPDDKGAQQRIERLFGSCVKKDVKDPRKK